MWVGCNLTPQNKTPLLLLQRPTINNEATEQRFAHVLLRFRKTKGENADFRRPSRRETKEVIPGQRAGLLCGLQAGMETSG